MFMGIVFIILITHLHASSLLSPPTTLLQDLSHELQSLRAQHAATQAQLVQAQVLHGMERERAAMREEDNQIR